MHERPFHQLCRARHHRRRHGRRLCKYVRIPGEILRIHKWALLRVPENVPFEYASIMDPICNAYKAVAQESGLRPGESAIVFGPGPIGLLAAQFCHMLSAKDVILVGLSADKELRADVANQMGVTEFIASDTEDLSARIHEICGREGADVAIDCAGAPIVLRQAIANVRKDGTIIKVGASAAAQLLAQRRHLPLPDHQGPPCL